MKKKVCFAVLGFLLLLRFDGQLDAELPGVRESFPSERVFVPASVPNKDMLSLLSFNTLTIQGQIVGAVALYDDPSTRRSSDYLELYNVAGSLVAVSWFDRFGIQRTALDRGLVEEDARLEGILVLLLEGEPA